MPLKPFSPPFRPKSLSSVFLTVVLTWLTGILPWISITFWPSFGFVDALDLRALDAPSTPAFSSALRTSSTVAGFGRLAVTRAPEVKSIPRLSWLIANEIAPIVRIIPESEKNHRLAPREVEMPLERAARPAPSARGDWSAFVRPNVPSTACVNSTAVNSETIVPTPSVNANPFTPAVASTNRMNAVNSVITFASIIVAMPLR